MARSLPLVGSANAARHRVADREDRRVLIGVDVGGTTTSGGLVTPEGEIVSAIQVPTHHAGPGTGVEALFEVVGDLLAEARSRGCSVEGIGVGIPGPVDCEKGMMLPFRNNHVPEFGDVPIAARLGALAGVLAFVDNDVNALALAEWAFGLGRGATSLVVLAIGSGAGGGIILDGRLVRGRGYAGELGHVSVKFDGPRCRCGAPGCLAAYLSGGGLAERARDRVASQPGAALLALAGGDPERITAALVSQAAAGDAVATALIEEGCVALAAGLGGIVNALNPEVIVVTGGVAAALLPRAEEVLRHVAQYALAPALERTRIHFVPSDKRRTVLGGAALVLYETRARGASPPPLGMEVRDAEVPRRA